MDSQVSYCIYTKYRRKIIFGELDKFMAAQAHSNSDLLQKTKQSIPKKERLEPKLIKLGLQMIRLKPKTRKGEDPKAKTKI